MATPIEETTPQIDHGFDPLFFWEQHKSKIVLFCLLLMGGLALFGIYEITTHRKKAAAAQAFAEAKSPEDYRKLIEKMPNTVVAGNAELLLAEQLRNEGKYDEALSFLKKLEGQKDYPLSEGVKLSIANTLAASGKKDEALSLFQELATLGKKSYVVPAAMVAQSNILIAQGKKEEAKNILTSLMADFPESSYTLEAQRNLNRLK